MKKLIYSLTICVLLYGCATTRLNRLSQEAYDDIAVCSGGIVGKDEIKAKIAAGIDEAERSGSLNSAVDIIAIARGAIFGSDLPQEEKVKLYGRYMDCLKSRQEFRSIAAKPKHLIPTDTEQMDDLQREFIAAFKARNITAMRSMLGPVSNYEKLIKDFREFFNYYSTAQFNISYQQDFEERGERVVGLKIVNLRDQQGSIVIGGTFRDCEIIIKRNEQNQWKVYWMQGLSR